MKQLLLVFLSILLTNCALAQGVTKNGKITTTGTEYVNKNGGVGGSKGVDKNGKIVSAVLTIGDNYQGGKIFYFFKSGDAGYVVGEVHGLITATAAVVSSIGNLTWGCTTSINTKTGIGDGKLNTQLIIMACAANGAARACSILSVDDNGTIYDDWYLPSKDELNVLLSENKTVAGTYYGFSSSQATGTANAWAYDGVKMMELAKVIPSPVLPVRTF